MACIWNHADLSITSTNKVMLVCPFLCRGNNQKVTDGFEVHFHERSGIGLD